MLLDLLSLYEPAATPAAATVATVPSTALNETSGTSGGYVVLGKTKIPPEFRFPRGDLTTPQDVLEWTAEQERQGNEEDEEEILIYLYS